MSLIGIYDSGIGGLCTLKIILDKFVGNDILYFADDLHCPLGKKSDEEAKEIVASAVKRLKARCDAVVLACNTASTVSDDPDVIKLLPPYVGDEALLLATDGTLRRYEPRCLVADTSDLAELVELSAEISAKSGKLSMGGTANYLSRKLKKFCGVKDVVLGCSHYNFCKREISDILGDVNFYDGNANVIRALEGKISALPERASRINFVFSKSDAYKKYAFILRQLMNCGYEI